MANFLNLQQRVANRGRLDLTQGSFSSLVQQFLNEAQKEIWEAKDWYFSVARQVVQTNTDTTAGTVTCTTGSAIITGSGTGFTNAMASGQFFILLQPSNDWYQISSVQSSTQLTMEVPFVGPTTLSGQTYTIRQFFYSLGANVDKILTARQTISPAYIDVVNYRDFDIFRPYPTATGDPRIMILWGYDSSNNLQFTPYPWPQQVENLEIRFKKKCVDMVNNTDTSLIPDKWNETVLVEGAYYKVCQYQDDGSSQSSHARYVTAKQVFESMLARMIAAENPDASYHPIIENRDKVTNAYGPILPYKYGVDSGP